MHRISHWAPWPFLLQKCYNLGHHNETLFCVLWATTYRGFFLIYCILWVMLASFLFCLVRLHLANLFHQLLMGMLHGLQHLNNEVGIDSGDSLLLLGPNTRSIKSFRLNGLVGRGWPLFYL